MKKYLSLIFALVLCFTPLCACGKVDKNDESSNVAEASAVELSFDEVSYFIPGEASEHEESDASETSNAAESSSESVSTDQQTGGFAVKAKTYAYQNNNVAILDVKNETNKNYSVTVKAFYLDADGKVLKTETQEFEQFASGYQKYFLFRPNIKFEKFTYELETKEFDGACPICDLVIEKVSLVERDVAIAELINKGDHTKYPAITADYKTRNKGNYTFRIGYMYTVVIGNVGEIFCIGQNAPTEYTPFMENDRGKTLYYTTDKELVWPDVLKGNVTILTVINSISDEDWLAAIS